MDLFLEKEYKEVMLKYEFALRKLETEIDILIKEHEFKCGYNLVEHVKSRIKSIDSASNKLKKKGCTLTVDNLIRNVHDMIGIRIVCSFLSDVYDIVSIIKSSNEFIIKDESDYIKNPKESGYKSYHMLVSVPIFLSDSVVDTKVEIQIRTIAMDFWASLEHKIYYKFEGKAPDYISQELRECADMVSALDDKMLSLNEAITALAGERYTT